MPKFTIDGQEIEFKQGQTIIEAASDNGIDIPHFCWHPKLSISGNCRMCLVEVEKIPKLAIACATRVAEDMVVHTKSERALDARKAVMEFILINHPLDCPICDEAGECKLQDYTYSHSIGESRFVEEKNHKGKRVELGPNVMFDGERCISCSRCIRFCTDVVGEHQLTFVQRGDRVTITTFEGKKLDNPYSMNTIDICPVGALTSKDFRFKARVWDMSSTKSVCTGCAKGCNIDIWVRSNKILRLTPRENEAVNGPWMCDYGRLNTFGFVNDNDRVNAPQIRREGKLRQAGWAEAFSTVTSDWESINGDEVAFIGSKFASCEDNYLLAKFAKEIVSTKNITVLDHIEEGFGDSLLKKDDRTPNSKGAELAGIPSDNDRLDLDAIMKGIDSGQIRILYVMEDDIVEQKPELTKVLKKLDLLIVHATNFNKTTEYAHVVFPASTYAEKNGVWINSDGQIQRIRPAVTTLEMDRSLDQMSQSRLDKFGTVYDRWGKVRKIDARPSWKILVGLANALGTKYSFDTSEDVFIEMTKNIDAFNELDYEDLGEQGVSLNAQPETV